MAERIRIIDTPPGGAPEWVRKEWIGVELPAEEKPPDPKEGIQFGVRGRKTENLGGYFVLTPDAISLLRKKSPEAAGWWERNVDLDSVTRFVFKREVCEIIPDAPANKP